MIVHLSSTQRCPTPSASNLTVSWDAENVEASHFGIGALRYIFGYMAESDFSKNDFSIFFMYHVLLLMFLC